MKARFWVAAVTSMMVISGCGVSSVKSMLGLPGASKPAEQMTPMERVKERFKVLQLQEACESCWVTGGGSGKDAESSCGTAKLALVAIEGDSTTVTDDKGRLNFSFDSNTGFHINGPVEDVRCVNVQGDTDGEGDTWGTVQFAGTVTVDKGIEASRFVVTVIDYEEPNTEDRFEIEIFDADGKSIFTYQCTTADGNIQIHPTREAQL